MNTKSVDILKRDRRTFPSRAYPDVVLAEGLGAYVTDIEGKRYIDMTSSSCILGHRHPSVVSAVRAQLDKLECVYACFVLPGEVFLKNAEALKSIVPGKLKTGKVVYFGSGTETVTFAKKLAKHATGKQAIIAHIGAHHGRLLDVTTDVALYKRGYAPFIVDCFYVPYPYCYRCAIGHEYPDCGLACLKYIEAALDTVIPPENVGAFLVEPLQSWNGFVAPPDDYFPKLKELCARNDILFVDDEVITGFGRTGKMFAIEHWNVEPDMICLGKAIGMGFAGSNAIVAPAQMIDSWPDSWGGIVGSAGGNLIACAASIAGIQVIIENDLVSKAAQLGRELHKILGEIASRHEALGAVNGKGLMLSVDIVDSKASKKPSSGKASRIVDFAIKEGLLLEKGIGTYQNVIRFIPPLTITYEEIEKTTDIFDRALRSIE